MVRLSEICQRQAKSFPGYSGQAQSTFVVLTSRGALAHSPTDSYHRPPLFRITLQLRYGRPINRSTLEERHGFLKSLASIMHSDFVRLVWIALPQRHARIGAVLAKCVVDHFGEAKLVPAIVVLAHNAPEGIHA